MNNLYFLGGVPRTGKSTITAEFLKRNPIATISTDAVAEAVRNMLTDDPFRILQEIKLDGWVKFKDPETEEIKTKNLNEYAEHDQPEHENSVVLRAILGMLDHYGRDNSDVLVEGCIFDPDWVSRHTFKDFNAHAAFVGFSSEDHITEIINHARNNENDWINNLLKHFKDDETPVRERLRKYIQLSEHTAASAESNSYGYFDLSAQPFDQYIQGVVDYLLS